MATIIFILALVTLAHLLFETLEHSIGFKQLKNLSLQTPLSQAKLPSVSIIFSALNEGLHVEKALRTMLNLNYPELEIIAINDRSTDETATILEKLAKEFKNLHTFSIEHLPENWLGKNHALYLGAKAAKNDWLLFTDADVLMGKDLLLKAISYTLENKVEHLTIYEQHLHKPFWLKVLSLGSYMGYCMTIKPWRIRFALSKTYLGHGAFNLVAKQTYFSCGGHQAIPLACLDDMKLGHLIKSKGFKQDTVNGRDFISREWYESLNGMVHGLSKNSFAYFNFYLLAVLRDFCFALLYYFWPILAIFLYSNWIFWLNILNILLTIHLSFRVCQHFRLRPFYSLFYPFSIGMLLYTVWYSVYLTYKNKGVIWRGTHYKLSKLRT